MRPTSTVSNESKVLMPNRTISDILSQFNPFRRRNRAIGCILTDWDNSTLSNLLIHWRPLGGAGVVEGTQGRFRLHYNNYLHTHVHSATHTHMHDNVMHTHCLVPRLTPAFIITGLELFVFAPRPVIQKSEGKPGNEASTHTHTHTERERARE